MIGGSSCPCTYRILCDTIPSPIATTSVLWPTWLGRCQWVGRRVSGSCTWEWDAGGARAWVYARGVS